jgi:hypothetical protein
MPSGVFDVKQIYLHDDSVCDIKKSTKVDLKNNAISTGDSFLADQSPGTPASMGHEDKTGNRGTNVYWASFYNDTIQLSPSCTSFENVTIYVSGLWTEINNIPIVPEHMVKTCIHYCEMEFFRIKRNRNPREFRAIYNDSLTMYINAKEEAMVLASRMDSFERKRISSYLRSWYGK